MPDKPKVKFTLDGRELEAVEGTLVIDAAKAAGIEVPHYCYHPGLGNPGVCRLCMVEVEGAPKPMVSCRLPVKAGMVVKSDTARARKAQASSLEFHLANHPLDCPVCDQAGECFLQDYYMRYGLYRSAVREDKLHKEKRLDIGPTVVLDQERCILCTRCTRFLSQVTKTNELGIFNRGDHDVLAPYPGRRVDNPYSGNIVDVCPVGALTDKDFRFKVRVWYLDETPSLCTTCARGCSIDLHANNRRPWHTPDERVVRFKPRHNPEVNAWWMCDEGRYSYKQIDSRLRLKFASRLVDGRPEAVAAKEAAARAAQELSALVKAKGPQGLAVVLSGTLSNEDLFAARRLFVETLHCGMLLAAPGPDQLGEGDDVLRRKERVPNHIGALALGFGARIPDTTWGGLRAAVEGGKLWGLYVIDRDPLAVWGKGSEKLLSGLAFTAYQGSHANRFSTAAQWVLPACSFAEEDATFTNFEGQVQRSRAAVPPLGESRPDWEIFRDMLAALEAPQAWTSAGGVFAELAKAEPPFASMAFEDLGMHGKRLARAPGPGSGPPGAGSGGDRA
ncbi:MAG: 2Fe-2S iron-sulfur cluster-binding protein [Elusimicrobia bacterium]|nr:2Fe-2S iron-sulfur cluster-binding protein [Elusimicrobiota bacterium]